MNFSVPPISNHIVNHLYPAGPDHDLVPLCGTTPGPEQDGTWHSGHGWDEFHLILDLPVHTCKVCLNFLNGPDDAEGEGLY